MPDWFCGPSACAHWLYDFQALVAGLVAAAAAIATVIVVRAQIRQATRDASRALEASRQNLERQIAHERELKAAEAKAARDRDTDEIATILANESLDLQRALGRVLGFLAGMRVTHSMKTTSQYDVIANDLQAAVTGFRDRLLAADIAIRPLSVRYTRAARERLTNASNKLIMLELYAGWIKFDYTFDEQFRKTEDQAQQVLAEINNLVPDLD